MRLRRCYDGSRREHFEEFLGSSLRKAKTRMKEMRWNEDHEPNFRKKRRSKLRVCHLAMPDEFKASTAVEVSTTSLTAF